MADDVLEYSEDSGSKARMRAFRAAALAAGMRPEDPWVGGYVDYEWRHLRCLLDAYGIEPQGKNALEFGCNVGASAVVLARLGAEVAGVDVDAAHVAVAAANIALHGVDQRAQALHLPDTRNMPFADGQFDFVIANSVLEYVEPHSLTEVICEIHRVMRRGAHLLICGTASRLAPREVHSRAWLANYLPRWIDSLTGCRLQRGLSPLLLSRALAGRFCQEQADRWLAARGMLHGEASLPVRMVDAAGRGLGVAPGWLGPNIELLLRRL
jgi:SAM-dependent methyltransferase